MQNEANNRVCKLKSELLKNIHDSQYDYLTMLKHVFKKNMSEGLPWQTNGNTKRNIF